MSQDPGSLANGSTRPGEVPAAVVLANPYRPLVQLASIEGDPLARPDALTAAQRGGAGDDVVVGRVGQADGVGGSRCRRGGGVADAARPAAAAVRVGPVDVRVQVAGGNDGTAADRLLGAGAPGRVGVLCTGERREVGGPQGVALRQGGRDPRCCRENGSALGSFAAAVVTVRPGDRSTGRGGRE